MPYLEVNDISKSFGKEKLLQGLSLQVNRGECVVVFGPSGCGKTVLLRLIAGVMKPDKGDIRIDGRSVLEIGPEQRGVAMAFQNFALYPHMSAFENIASPLRARGAKEAEIKQRVHDVASLLRIAHVLTHLPRQLSNGQKQRTSLARSLVHGPAVLMLDDPLRNVDAKVRYEMRLELPSVFRQFQSTVIYVTQDYKEAMAFGQRVGVLLDGCFQQVDTPEGVYRDPNNTQVASLFGDPPINLFPIHPERKNGGVQAMLGGQPLALPATRTGLAGRDCLLGVRPEDIDLCFERGEGDIQVELDTVMPFNVRTVMLLKTPDNTEILASCPEDHSLQQQRGHHKVWARFKLDNALFFDRATGAKA